MSKSAEFGQWRIAAHCHEDGVRQTRVYRKVWIGFVTFSVALIGVHLRKNSLIGTAGRLPWQGLMFAWPLSIYVLYKLLNRAETLPAAIFSRLVSSSQAYKRRCQTRTVLSHNGLATVFRSLVFTNCLSLVLPFGIQETQSSSAPGWSRLLKAAAWTACVVTVAVSATILGLMQSQAPIDFAFLEPHTTDNPEEDTDNGDEIHRELVIAPDTPPLSTYFEMLKPGSWKLIANTSRRHNVYLRLNTTKSSDAEENTLEITTELASDHPLYNVQSARSFKPQLTASRRSG